MYYECVTRSLISPSLFKTIIDLEITGTVNSIESQLFSVFTRLQVFTLKISNFKDFFHRNHRWMVQMNSGVSVDYKSIRQVKANLDKLFVLILVSLSHFLSFESVYTYRDEDLCLFKDFPHKSLVAPQVYSARILNCTCTLKWLHLTTLALTANRIKVGKDSYVEQADQNEPDSLSSVFAYCVGRFQLLDCDFTSRFNKCHVNTEEKLSNNLLDY